MPITRFVCSLFFSFAFSAVCLFSSVWADDAISKPTLADVALSDGGTLEGLVVNAQYTGLPGVPVTLQSQDRNVVQTTTDANGRFVVQDLRGGVYQVATAQSNGTFRLWAPRTAPPAAGNRAVVYVQNNGPVNGGGNGIKYFLGHPLILPAIIASAIAVPIAVSSSHRSASP
jgi:hypothetical protein